ncbi:MAG TPA: hypothetical protein VMZ53_01570 [Kofleriaceae bacterium]|nr:hypothetical protein [Kofleriaceae bacterium]
MGAAPASLLVAAFGIVAATAMPARADECTGNTPGVGKFALCFDPGTRISITAGTDGFGAGIAVRHIVHFADEPDLVWRLEHVALDGVHAPNTEEFDALLYRGRYTRHARDGHIVIPLGTPKKVFLPFDIGGVVEAGALTVRDERPARLRIVKVAGILDFARSRTFRKRLAFGPVARWDVDVATKPWDLGEHIVSPFSEAMANLHYETTNGRFVADLRVEAGMAWRSTTGWEPTAEAEASIERIMLAINDRPISLVLGARYQTETEEAIAKVGARIVLFDHRDPRVQRID